MIILSQEKICTHKGCTVWLQRIQDHSPPDYAEWCVHFAGNGHYFPEYDDAIEYIRKRKFLNNKQIQELRGEKIGTKQEKTMERL